MQYQVFVEQLEQQVAVSVIGLPTTRVTGSTRAEALTKLADLLKTWQAEGKLATLELAANGASQRLTGNPWLDNFGIFKDDPTWDEFQENIAAYRRELDEAEAAKETASEVVHSARQ